MGGVRSSYLDVPTARYFKNASAPGGNSPCQAIGAEEPFSREKLVSLYGDHKAYVNRVVQRANELEREGWLLLADADETRKEAAQRSGFRP